MCSSPETLISFGDTAPLGETADVAVYSVWDCKISSLFRMSAELTEDLSAMLYRG